LRVYEYAKQLNMSSKEILTILQRLNIPVNNHMSVMDPEMIDQVEKFFRDVKERASAKQEEKIQAEAAKRKEALKSSALEQKKAVGEHANRAKPDAGHGSRSHSGGQRPPGQAAGQRPKGAGNRTTGSGRTGAARPQGGSHAAEPAWKRPAVSPRGGEAVADDTFEELSVRVERPVRKQKPGMRAMDPKDARRNGTFGRRPPGTQNKGAVSPAPKAQPQQPMGPKKITITGPMSVGEFAKLIRRDPPDVIKKLLFLGIVATINQEIDIDAMTLVADEYGIEVEVKLPKDEEAMDMLMEEEDPANLVPRPPVVTIMGHVDHGKTTLLDAIRKTNVTAQEAGGITQHIGAYQVDVHGKKITFLDTPGHAAFTTMRARGAQVTDITVLVVAADDGVMPQTVEAIHHAKAAGVPIIVAVNKIDKPDANPDRVKQELTEHGLVPEDWGGDTVYVHVSALKRVGLEELLEMILLVAEMAELKANPKGRPRGTIIEAKLDKGRGPVATVLVQNGTLSVGDIVVAGSTYGKVRAMVNDRGRRIREAGPSTPVEIIGLNDVPSAGDPFVVYDDERKARLLAEKRKDRQRLEEQKGRTKITLDDLYKQIQEGQVKELNVIIKGDVHGSVEALVGALSKIEVAGVRVRVIHEGVGAITESDIILASASNAIVIGFNVRPEPNAKKMAESEKVDVRLYRVIYDVIEEIEAAMKGMLDPEYKEVVIGRAEVRQIFKVSRVGTIAGCYVTEGKITRNAEARLIRDGIVIHEGRLDSLKRFKDDVREVSSGYECGLTFEHFNDIKEGDVIEVFAMETVKI
jgi:translation initiation factor IF-2